MAQKTSGSAKATSIETNDIAPIPAGERHGKAWHLFTVWSSPNLEFATIFIGALAVFAGLNVWQAILAVTLGNAIAAVTHGWFSSWGPRHGVPQMVISRSAFGLRGNILPAATSTLVAGIGWFAVNTTSGAFALTSLTSLPVAVSVTIIIVVQVVAAFIGHNFIQKFERYAFFYLAVVFAIVAVIIISQGKYDVNPATDFKWGAFSVGVALAYGYTQGWTAFAADFTRYLPANTSPRAVGLAAGLGNFTATTLLMSVGAIAWSGVVGEGLPTTVFAEALPSWLAVLTLVGIAVGSVSANVLNIYSGTMSFIAAGVKLGFKTRRAIMVVIAGVLGGGISYFAVEDNFRFIFELFLLTVGYWLAPWVSILVVDRLLRKGQDIDKLITEGAKHRSIGGPIAFVVATVVSVSLFAKAEMPTVQFYGALTGPGPENGDWTAATGFVMAAVIYYVIYKLTNKK
ncbi:MAG: cytosine permease [Rhodoluna sp.]|jgi:NCS1 family nucleobase:cation symporter-1|nr:cytosine permease [Rhodoluna sp.]